MIFLVIVIDVMRISADSFIVCNSHISSTDLTGGLFQNRKGIIDSCYQ